MNILKELNDFSNIKKFSRIEKKKREFVHLLTLEIDSNKEQISFSKRYGAAFRHAFV